MSLPVIHYSNTRQSSLTNRIHHPLRSEGFRAKKLFAQLRIGGKTPRNGRWVRARKMAAGFSPARGSRAFESVLGKVVESVLRGTGFRPPAVATGTGVRGTPPDQTPSAFRRLACVPLTLRTVA
ncbi:unnamed protein product [Leptosia nina]|uniref:Uncharacterized protein n=1 Tax=Leptosia nina TaxID=320188 RepID=A0AAV1K2J5_9NEOP